MSKPDKHDMLKIAIGFLLGLGIGAASADSMMGTTLPLPDSIYLNAGVGPDNKMAPIRVDEMGYVICSKVKP